MPKYSEVVRVATTNNFNCTDNEFRSLKIFEQPTRYLFINSNINTIRLPNLNNYPYKVVLTLNPDITFDMNDVLAKLSKIDPAKVAFVRIKYVPDNIPIKALIQTIKDHQYNIVLTLQRFNNKKTLAQYTDLKYYKHSCSRWRLNPTERKRVLALADSLAIHVCDRKDLGCQGCGLCSKLTIGYIASHIKSLNLSKSGICPYNCPDCYAKTMQRFLKAIEQPLIHYDYVHKNHKQSGRTVHIKEAQIAQESDQTRYGSSQHHNRRRRNHHHRYRTQSH